MQKQMMLVSARDVALSIVSQHFIAKGNKDIDVGDFPDAVYATGTVTLPSQSEPMGFTATLKLSGEPRFIAVGMRATPVRRWRVRYETYGVTPDATWRDFPLEILEGATIEVAVQPHQLTPSKPPLANVSHTLQAIVRGHRGFSPGTKAERSVRNRSPAWEFKSELSPET